MSFQLHLENCFKQKKANFFVVVVEGAKMGVKTCSYTLSLCCLTHLSREDYMNFKDPKMTWSQFRAKGYIILLFVVFCNNIILRKRSKKTKIFWLAYSRKSQLFLCYHCPSKNKCHKIQLPILFFLRSEIKFLFKLKYLNIHTSKWCYLHLLVFWNNKAIFKREEKSW